MRAAASALQSPEVAANTSSGPIRLVCCSCPPRPARRGPSSPSSWIAASRAPTDSSQRLARGAPRPSPDQPLLAAGALLLEGSGSEYDSTEQLLMFGDNYL